MITPLKPASVKNRYFWPSHEPCIKPGLATTPAGATIEGKMLIWGDAVLLPNFCYFVEFARGLIQVSVILHMISIATTVGKNCAGDSTFGLNIIVTTHLPDVFGITAYTNKFSVTGCQHFLGLGNIYGQLRLTRNLCSKI